MHRVPTTLFFSIPLLLLACGFASAQTPPPREWIEPATGHRVVRLTDEPGSQSLYFHQHPFSSDGRNMVYTSPQGIHTVDLETRACELIVPELPEVIAELQRPNRDPEAPIPGKIRILVTGRKTGDVYFARNNMVYAANLETRALREAAQLDPCYRWGNIAPNADETLLVAIAIDPEAPAEPRRLPGAVGSGRLGPTWAKGESRMLFVIDQTTGDARAIHHSHDWLNHLQCSPTDTGQILFCHEGPWHYVDRTWLIRTDGTGLTQVHLRTIDMEIAGHEFFSPDGRTVWYDLQTPRSMIFWLAGYEIETGKRTWYHLQRSEWSVHYNLSPDGKLFSGDGGGPASVANMSASHDTLDPPGNGMWMYLFHPELITMHGLPEQSAGLIQTGEFRSERLVDLSQHDYELEPNGIFSPDGQWLIFRSNLHGDSYVYAVELAEAGK